MVKPASLANLEPASNGRALTHGAYAPLRLSDAAGETADTLRELVPLSHDADTAAIETFAFVLEQLRGRPMSVRPCAARAGRAGVPSSCSSL